MSRSHSVRKSSDDASHIVGFRNFLTTPKPSERFNGKYKLSQEDLDKALKLLAERIGQESNRIDVNWDNENIPSGYTYLAQLIGHDFVFNSASLISINNCLEQKNLRKSYLQLDTVYGADSVGFHNRYYSPYNEKKYKTNFRLSSIKGNKKAFRDLPRSSSCYLQDSPDIKKKILSDILAADIRNDGNIILSQLTTLFCLLHNIIINKINYEKDSRIESEIKFEATKKVVIAIYHKIIREDFLNKILHPDIYGYYNNDLNDFFSKKDDKEPSMELCHAVFRFGHSMVRPNYKLSDKNENVILEDVMRYSSLRNPHLFPLPSDWLVAWSNFFCELGPEPPANMSRVIGPHIAKFLNKGTRNGQVYIYCPFERSEKQNEKCKALLPYRDLVRGSSSKMSMWSVHYLIKEIEKKSNNDLKKIIAGNKLFKEWKIWVYEIKKWLDEYKVFDRESKIKEFLSNDPPLYFFTLFEAKKTSSGKTLGPLGSIIIAEEFFKLLRSESNRNNANLKKYGSLCTESYDEIFFKNLSDLTNLSGKPSSVMSEVIKFVEKNITDEDLYAEKYPII
ncbi:MAG: peroxidase family protein [Gammaproteobacteria bacterium]